MTKKMNMTSSNAGVLVTRKQGVTVAVILFALMLALHNPTGGYVTSDTSCDTDAIAKSGGPPVNAGALDRLFCADRHGVPREVTRKRSPLEYESIGAFFGPAAKVSSILLGTVLIFFPLLVWLRLAKDDRNSNLKIEDRHIEDKPTEQVLPDFTWQIAAANWFFIGVGALIQDSIRAGGYAGGAGQFFGRLFAIALGAIVPVAVIYVANRNKKGFRIVRALTIAGWCMLVLMFYPLLRP